MARSSGEDPPEAKRLPRGRVGRTARVGGLVTGQGLRWAGTQAANRLRTPERAEAAERERTAALVEELVEQLGRMRGAAMKVGQMLSMAEFEGLPEDQERELQEKLAALRDGIPPVPFSRLEKLLRQELGGPLADVFSEFDERAFAAASIGQVHRATTIDGDDVAVKVQYPGVAEAVDTDLRNAMLLVPLIKRLAPGLDGRALGLELGERVREELDYELEAQNQRRIERLLRGHPFMHVPHVHTDLSSRRVLVTEYVEGERFETVRHAEQATRDRFGEIVFRFFFGVLYRDRIALGDPHPGNYLLRPDGRVSFLDFGLLREASAERVAAEAAIAAAVRAGDPAQLKASLTAGGYLPAERAESVEAELALRMMTRATSWYAVPGHRQFGADPAAGADGSGPGSDGETEPDESGAPEGERELRVEVELERDFPGERPDPERRAAIKHQVNQFTIPPDAILIRRMHGFLASVLHSLRAGGDWGAIAAEYLHGEGASSELGVQEAEFLSRRGR